MKPRLQGAGTIFTKAGREISIVRAIAMDRIGGPEVLYPATLDRPRPGPGEVVVQVAYAGVNPADWKAREGSLARYFDYHYPFVPGFDAAGWVAAVGRDVAGLAVGDRVVAISNFGRGERGSYAEFVVSSAELTVRLPAHVGLAEAAALPTAGTAAWQALFNVGRLQRGMSVLVNGGAGGVGGFAIQLAVAAGARVAATCSRGNRDYVLSLGADVAIDYSGGPVREKLLAWRLDGVDLLVDTVGGDSLPNASDLVRAGGVWAAIGNSLSANGARSEHPAPDRRITHQIVFSTFDTQPPQLRGLVDALAKGTLKAPAMDIVPLEEAAKAQQRLATGHGRGKILLHVADER
ncbi:NADP-dependent oxidoreductase [Sphingobium estronivorans]|uniref:NADP-dependent oxidoreductase n=1 Tax=Sphingobium estronivorans TaxID=1577690 RepID=UPI0012385ADE|nr:NADP-dependent oxidoreductase [Sphingobium estronivorans]